MNANEHGFDTPSAAPIFEAYIDESADGSKERVFAVAGVIGTREAWDALTHKWLERTHGVPFHAKDCDSDRRQYARTPHQENKDLYRDLAILLAGSGLGGHGVAIDLAAQRAVFPHAPDIAYYKGLAEVLAMMKNCAANNGHSVRFTLDSREESDHNAGMLYEMLRDTTEWKAHMPHELSFASSRENPRVQVADLVARECMKAWDNRIGSTQRPPRGSWMALYKTGRFHADVLSTGWFESLKTQMPLLEERTGMSSTKYAEWLTQNNLQPNTTNLLRFAEWDKPKL